MITVEVSDEGQKIEVILDQDGLSELKAHLLTAEKDGDAHLRAPSWAGDDLSEEQSSQSANVVLAKELTFRFFS